MSVKMRQEIEHKIVSAAITQLLAAGYLLGVNDGEETTIHHSTDAKAIEKAMFTTDEDFLFVYVKGDDVNDLRPQYWVHFVYGNDGWDVMSDYTIHLEKDLTEAQKIADHYGD